MQQKARLFQPSLKPTYYNIYVAVVVMLLVSMGHGISDEETFTQELPMRNYRTSSAVEQFAGYEQDGKLKYDTEMAIAKQTNEDVLAIGQAFVGFDDVLSKEQSLLSVVQNNVSITSGKYYRDEEEDIAEIEKNLEMAETENNNEKYLDDIAEEESLMVEEDDVDLQSLYGDLDDNALLYKQEENSPSQADFFDNEELVTYNTKEQGQEDEEEVNANDSYDEEDCEEYDGDNDEKKNDQKNSKGKICSTAEKLFRKLRNRGLISSKSSLVNFKANSRQELYLRDFIPIKGYNELKIKYIKFNCDTSLLSIETKPAPTWTIIPGYMSIRRVKVSITFKLQSVQRTLKIVMQGNWLVGNLNIAVTAVYHHASGITHIVASPRTGTSLKSFVKSITDLTLPVSSSIKIDFKFEGKLYKSGAVFLLLSSDKQSNKFYALYKKKGKKYVPTKAIAVEVRRFRLSSLVRRLTREDFSHAPFFGRLVVPNTGLIFSTGKMTVDGRKVFRRSPLLRTTKNKISKGLSVFMRVPFHHEPLIAKYYGGVLVITTPHRNLRLDKLLHFMISGGGVRSVTFPLPQLKQILRLYIEIVKVSRHSVSVTVSYPRPVIFFERFLRLSRVKATIVVRNQRPRVSVEITGNIHLAGGNFKTKLAQNKHKKYKLTSVGDRLNINRVIRAFHSAVLPREIQIFLQKIPFLRVTIVRPKISYTFGARPQQIHIGGTPIMHGYRIVNMDFLLVKLHGRMQAIMAFELGGINLAEILSKVTGFNFKMFSLLNQRIHGTVSLSPITSNRLRFSVGRLASLSIRKGFSLRAPIKFPRHCGSDKFCKFAGTLVGHNMVLSIQFSILSANYYSVKASINKNLHLGKGLNFYDGGLEIVGGSSPRMGLVGKLRLNKPHLIFAARISKGTKGLSIQLSMKNCWHKPFGAEWLDICDLLGSVDFVPPKVITGFEIGAQIRLGYRSTRHQLRAKVYMGFSKNPIERYYYARFHRVNMHSLLRAFRLNWHLPRPLRESGFPHGFLYSYSLLGKYLPPVRLHIPRGYRIKGTLDILGLRGHTDITIGLPKLVDVNVALPPIRIGRVLAMYASSRDRRRGPYLKAKIQFYRRHVNIEASGYLHVLGIAFHSKLKITNSHYSFHFRHKIFNLFIATVHMSATYRRVSHAHFNIRGSFEPDLFRSIQNIANGLIRHFSVIAKQTVDAAKRALRHFQHLRHRAVHSVNNLMRRINYLRKKIFFAKIMEGKYDSSDNEAAKINWFRRVVRHGTRIVRKVVRHPKRIIKRVVKRINHHVQRLFNAAKHQYNRARHHLHHVTHMLHKKARHFHHVRHHLRNSLNMFNFMIRHGLHSMISIQRITFSASLGMASSGRFSCGITVRFLRRHTRHFNAVINIRSLGGLGRHFFHLVKRFF